MLISLKDLISEIEDEKLNKLLTSFKCDLDPDIEFFLKDRAVTFERLSKARTYLIIDEDELETKSIEEINILGYVALALKVLTVPESVSNRMRSQVLCYRSNSFSALKCRNRLFSLCHPKAE